MTVKDFRLPDLGEGLTEGTIVEWLVDVGDTVAVDQAVAQVETAKAVVEVPCPFDGEITALHAEPGQEVEVGQPLLSVATGGAGGGQSEEAAGAAGREAAADEGVPDQAASEGDDGDGESGSVLVGYGTQARKARRRRAKAAARNGGNGHAPAAPAATEPAPAESQPTAPADAGPPAHSGRPLAKPPVRKLAKDLGVDLWQVRPSGPDGVITREDVHAAAPGQAAPDQAPAAADGEAERIPVTGIRKRIADRMSQSRAEIPEATTWVDCDATDLMRVRDELNARQDDVKVTPLAVVLRACVAGLRRFPELNSSFDADAGEIVRHRAVHLGVAAQTDRGLLVPVIRDAHEMSILELAAELRRLSEGARDGKLSPGELSGSTFSVSNYGAFGVDGGNPVINHPEAAILGVGQIADRPWVVDGELAVRKVCQLSIAFDHRVCDGGEAAGFLRFVADCMESTTTLLAEL